MSTTITESQRLTEEHARVVLQAQALTSEIAERGDGLTAAEREQIDRITAEAADLREQRDSARALESLAAEGDQAAQMVERLSATTTDAVPDADRDIDEHGITKLQRLARQVEIGESSGGVLRADIGRVRKQRALMELGVTADDVTAAAKRGVQFDAAGREVRAYNVGTAASGGYLVPTLFERQLYDFMEYTSGVRSAGATVLTTESGAVLEVPTLTAHFGVSTTSITAEAATVADTDDTFGEVRLNSYAFTAAFTASKELIQDNAINFDEYIGRSLGRTMMKKTEYAFTNGSGTNQPQGLYSSPPAAATVTTAGSNTIAYADLLGMIFRLDAAYIMSPAQSCWTMGPETYQAILGIVDADNRPLFLPSFYTMEPDMILGRKVVYNPYCPAGTATDNAIVATYGDHSDGYIIRDVGMVQVAVSPHVKFDQRQVMFLADMRCDGRRLHQQALSWLRIKA